MNFFPEAFNVKILNVDTINPISNIAIKVRLFAKLKNDYYFIPSVSNREGIIKIRRLWLYNEVEKIRSLFSMDYSSTLYDCEPKIEFKIMTINEVNQAINAMTEWKYIFNTPEAEIQSFLKVANWQYEPDSKIIYFNNQNEIDVNLLTKTVKKDKEDKGTEDKGTVHSS